MYLCIHIWYIPELNLNFEYQNNHRYEYEKYPAYEKGVINQSTIKSNLKPQPSQPLLSVWRKICFLENQPRQDSSLLGVFLETVVALLITNVADDNLKELLLSKIHWPDGISMKWCSSSNRLHLPHGSILHRAAGSHVLHHVYKKNWKCAMLPLLSVYTYTSREYVLGLLLSYLLYDKGYKLKSESYIAIW